MSSYKKNDRVKPKYNYNTVYKDNKDEDILNFMNFHKKLGKLYSLGLICFTYINDQIHLVCILSCYNTLGIPKGYPLNDNELPFESSEREFLEETGITLSIDKNTPYITYCVKKTSDSANAVTTNNTITIRVFYLKYLDYTKILNNSLNYDVNEVKEVLLLNYTDLITKYNGLWNSSIGNSKHNKIQLLYIILYNFNTAYNIFDILKTKDVKNLLMQKDAKIYTKIIKFLFILCIKNKINLYSPTESTPLSCDAHMQHPSRVDLKLEFNLNLNIVNVTMDVRFKSCKTVVEVFDELDKIASNVNIVLKTLINEIVKHGMNVINNILKTCNNFYNTVPAEHIILTILKTLLIGIFDENQIECG